MFLSNYIQRIYSSLKPTKPRFKEVSSLLFTSLTNPSNNSHLNKPSIKFTGIANSLINKCSHLYNNKINGKTEGIVDGVSLKHLLLDVSCVVPGVIRRFRRVSKLKPENLMEIFVGFELECERSIVKSVKVESLWTVFMWGSENYEGFRDFPKLIEVMVSILVRFRMFREVQLLILDVERKGVVMENSGIFYMLIRGYVGVSDVDRAILVYDQVKERGLAMSVSCYGILVDQLVRMKRSGLAYKICSDMLDAGFTLSEGEMARFENVARLLCGNGMVQEARSLVKRAMVLGFKPSSFVVDEIACGYCEKRDFEDSLRVFHEMKGVPSVVAGNKIIFRMCTSLGVERTELFRYELEDLGFNPDEITFGILIGWCCQEGNLRVAFVYLEEMLSRGLKPNKWSYNALIAAVFNRGMWKHARDILDEMVDNGTSPDLSTYKILLSGYSKCRQFDELKKIVHEMENHGLIGYSYLKDPLSKAFTVLGFNPLLVRLKRDNNTSLLRTEFYDNLGNGLYLDADLDEFEKSVNEILNNSMLPDFNFLLSEEGDCGNYKDTMLLIDEMVRWGQDPSPSVYSVLLSGLCASRRYIKSCSTLMEKMPKLVNQLDEGALNLIVQAYCKKGWTYKGWITFKDMLQRDLKADNKTYTALIIGLLKIGHFRWLHDCWDVALRDKWVPELGDCGSLLDYLFRHDMLKEVFELLETLLVTYPQTMLEVCHMFIEKLCINGCTSSAHILIDELLCQGYVLDGVAYSHLIQGYCRERKHSVAFTILNQMLSRNLVPCFDASLDLIPQLCKANKLEEAVELTKLCSEEQSFSFFLRDALIKGLCMAGKIDEAANQFRDILIERLHSDAEISNTLFLAYARSNNLRRASELLGIMIRRCFSLSLMSYRHGLRMVCKKDKVKFALNLKEQMLREEEYDRVVIYNILVFHLLSTGNNLLVHKILNELEEKGLEFSGTTYDFLVHGLSKCNNISNSLWYLSNIIQKGFKPSNRSLRTVITSLCEHRELHKSLELSREMVSRGWIHGSAVQNAIVEALHSHNELQEAEKFLDTIADKGLIPNTINYDNLVKLFCRERRLNKAIDLIDIMLKKGNVPASSSYDSVICTLCTSNQPNQALDFLTEMLDKDLKPSIDTWELLTCRLCQIGNIAEAESLISSMAQVGETPTRLMYSTVIDRYRAENNLAKASQLMQMMQKHGYAPDFDAHWSLISKLSNSGSRDSKNSSRQGFLSTLLSGGGFLQNRPPR